MALPQFPSIPTITPGQAWTAALFNTVIAQGLSFLAAPPVAQLYQATAQTLANNTATPISFDGETSDTYGGHSLTTSNSEYICQYPGYYLLLGGVAVATNTSGYRRAHFTVNGSVVQGAQGAPAPNYETVTTTSAITYLTAGQYVQLIGWQYSGSSLATLVSGGIDQSWMHVLWVHV